MKLLYLAPDPVPAPKGAAVRIERTLRTLVDLGHEVELFTPARPNGRLGFLPHDTVELPQENFLERMLAFRHAATEWLADRRAEAVQFRGLWEGIAALDWARRHGARAIYEAHGFPSIELRYHFPGLEGEAGLMEKLISEEERLLCGADRMITPSRTGARFLRMRAVPAERIAVVPNAVDPELFSPPAAPSADEPPYRLAYAGTLAPWQGLGSLLEALVRFRGHGVELHVVGPNKRAWRRRLRHVARRLRVHHQLHLSSATTQADLAPVLRSAHVCVAPMPADARNAVQGCCPLKVLEYMAAGRPILATRIPPLAEILEHERTAWLVAPGSPAALADGLAWLLQHPGEREELGRAARRDVLSRWHPEQFRTRLAAALDGVVGSS